MSNEIRSCTRCKRFITRPYQQLDTYLPLIRLQPEQTPFTHILWTLLATYGLVTKKIDITYYLSRYTRNSFRRIDQHVHQRT